MILSYGRYGSLLKELYLASLKIYGDSEKNWHNMSGGIIDIH
jgi:hypothetical protein